MQPMTTNEIAEAVKAHAIANYEKDGWDYLVECYSLKDIVRWIEEKGWTDAQQAIEGIGEMLAIKDSIRKDMEAEAF